MGLFSAIGGLFDKKPSKRVKRYRDRLGRAFFEGGRPAEGEFQFTPGVFSGATGTGTFGPITPIGSASAAGKSPADLRRMGARIGGGYAFSPEMQELFDSGLDRANIVGDLFEQYVGPDFFTKGPLFDMLNESRIGRVQRGEDAAANALSQLFNTGGINTASMMDMSKVNADLAAAKAAEDANVLFNLQKFLGTGLGQSQEALDYIDSLNVMGLDLASRARDASVLGTNLEMDKYRQYFDAEQMYQQQKASEPGLGSTLGGLADAGLSFYAGGGGFGEGGFDFGQALQSQFNPNYQMDRFMDRYGGFGGNQYGMFGQGTGFGSEAEQDLIREILSGRSSGYSR
tara:strand:+ start:7055 stop:8083 length:1029 start_codon:yes stop_codon:yes gene_type:complete